MKIKLETIEIGDIIELFLIDQDGKKILLPSDDLVTDEVEKLIHKMILDKGSMGLGQLKNLLISRSYRDGYCYLDLRLKINVNINGCIFSEKYSFQVNVKSQNHDAKERRDAILELIEKITKITDELRVKYKICRTNTDIVEDILPSQAKHSK